MKLTKKILKEMIEEEVLKKKIMSERMDLRESTAGEVIGGASKFGKWLKRILYSGGGLGALSTFRNAFGHGKIDLTKPVQRERIKKKLKKIGKGDKVLFYVPFGGKNRSLYQFVQMLVLAIFVQNAGAMVMKWGPGRLLAKDPDKRYFNSWFTRFHNNDIRMWINEAGKPTQDQLEAIYDIILEKYKNLDVEEKKKVIKHIRLGLTDLYNEDVTGFISKIQGWIHPISYFTDTAFEFLSKLVEYKIPEANKQWIILCAAAPQQVQAATKKLQNFANTMSPEVMADLAQKRKQREQRKKAAAKLRNQLAGGPTTAREKKVRELIKNKLGQKYSSMPLENIIFKMHTSGLFNIQLPNGTVKKNLTADQTKQQTLFRTKQAALNEYAKKVRLLTPVKKLDILEKALGML